MAGHISHHHHHRQHVLVGDIGQCRARLHTDQIRQGIKRATAGSHLERQYSLQIDLLRRIQPQTDRHRIFGLITV